LFRFLTAGESHGRGLVAVVEGTPAGLAISADYINTELARRQKGYGRGGRMAIENDRAEIISGIRLGKTLGSPIALVVWNKDWDAWQNKMAVEAGSAIDDSAAIWIPRPGHADIAGAMKYTHYDIRNVLERASARETCMRVAVGAIAKRILEEIGLRITSHVIQIGKVKSESESVGFEEILQLSEQSPVRCINQKAEQEMMAAIDRAKKNGDTLGGVFEVIAEGVPIGLGSYVHWDRRLDGMLAQAIMSIPAVKGVEIGMGFESAEMPGSKVHDEIGYEDGRYVRRSNNAGGLEGGVTNGEPIVIRAAMKPISTLMKPLKSIDMRTRETAQAHTERSDICAVPAAAVTAEAMTAIVLASAVIEKFGGDSMQELLDNIATYKQRIASR